MIQINGETYHNASSAAEYLNVTREMFYKNVKPQVPKHKQKGGKRWLYRQSDLDQFCGLVTVAS